MKLKLYTTSVCLSFCLLFLLVPVAFAQGFVPEPPPEDMPPAIGGPIRIELHSVDAVVDAQVATVHVTQIFRNLADWQIEGTYIFPLPENAAVGDFQMTVDGQVLEGEVMDSERARRIYENIVRQRRDPALLEYLGHNLFQTSVFPIPPGETRKLELTYTQVLDLQGGLYNFRYPLQTRQYATAPVQNLAVRVELRNQPGLRTLYSPSHNVSIDRIGDDAALVGFEVSNVQPERDFDLYFGVSKEAVGLNLLSYKPSGEDGFFLLLASPGIDVAADEVVQRDLILVMDISGSMEGTKLAQAKQAAHFLIDNLNPGDRFNMIGFSTGVKLWEEQLQKGTSESPASAHRFIDSLKAAGSTDINRAVLEALGQLQGKGNVPRPAYILFMTDGLPTQGVTESDRIVANALLNTPKRSVRLFTFGVGYDVDTDLLDTLSSELGGRSSYVKPDERIDEVLGDFYDQISTPVLANVSIELPGMRVDDTYPYPLPDLFAGEQLVVAGRYRQGGDTAVTLRGYVNGQERSFSYPGQRLVSAGGEPLVARLWATRKIGALLDQVRRQGPNDELIDTIVNLSTTYGIVTPYTSYLVLEPEFRDQVAIEPRVRATPAPGIGGFDGAAAPEAAEAPKEVVVTVEVEMMAAEPASGERAVSSSEARSALREADRAVESQGTRYVGGKSFSFQGMVTRPDGTASEFWVDHAYKTSMPVQPVLFGSEAYFELAAEPDVAQWLAISPELVLVIDDTAYRISSQETIADQPHTISPLPTPTPEVGPPSTTPAGTGFLDWLRRLFGLPG
ncbi:MAG: VWA domain-containing protein [Chloroflexi bacterium]|nr:VWA domain-containing protein [Chloroflexota bacterium]